LSKAAAKVRPGSTRFRTVRHADSNYPAPLVWSCISSACQDVLRESKIDPALVKGIGFDATCSLVAADIDSGKPITVTPNSWEGAPQAANDKGEFRDIILWADRESCFAHSGTFPAACCLLTSRLTQTALRKKPSSSTTPRGLLTLNWLQSRPGRD
jgi:hypothetical protein